MLRSAELAKRFMEEIERQAREAAPHEQRSADTPTPDYMDFPWGILGALS